MSSSEITYKIILALKNAGFPMPKLPIELKSKVLRNNDSDEEFLTPTLSQLIEACGEEFKSLVVENPTTWVAYNGGGFGGIAGKGSTPEEAVANLWLELNKI